MVHPARDKRSCVVARYLDRRLHPIKHMILAHNMNSEISSPNVQGAGSAESACPAAPCSLDRWIQVVLSVSPTGGTLRIRDEKSYRPSELSVETVAELSEMMKAWGDSRQCGEVVLYEHGTPSSIKSNRCGTAQLESLWPDKMNLGVGAVGIGVVPTLDVSDGVKIDVDGSVVDGDADCIHKFSKANV